MACAGRSPVEGFCKGAAGYAGYGDRGAGCASLRRSETASWYCEGAVS